MATNNNYRVEISYDEAEAKAMLHIETPGGEVTKSLSFRQGFWVDENNQLADENTVVAITWLLKTCSDAQKNG